MNEIPANYDGALPLPSAWYVAADAFVRERRTIFAEGWQMIARKGALGAAGDYVCQSLAGLAVFALRDEAGGIRTFLNVCRHQGLPVLDSGTGRLSLMRCRYHGWTYNFDGSFKEAPLKFEPAAPSAPENGLQQVPLLEWRGLIFISPSGSPADFAADVKPLEPVLDRALAAPLALAAEITTDAACNWKLLAEHWLAHHPGSAPAGAEPHWLWHFPTLALEPGPGSLVVHQLIPRTHERSRVVSHLLAADKETGLARAEAVKARLAADKTGAEELQALASRGEAGPRAAAGSAVATFRARIAAAHARATAQDRG